MCSIQLHCEQHESALISQSNSSAKNANNHKPILTNFARRNHVYFLQHLQFHQSYNSGKLRLPPVDFLGLARYDGNRIIVNYRQDAR